MRWRTDALRDFNPTTIHLVNNNHLPKRQTNTTNDGDRQLCRPQMTLSVKQHARQL